MNFKECKKYGRDEMLKNDERYCYLYKDNNNGWYFSFIENVTHPPIYLLEKSGIIRRRKYDNQKHVFIYE